MKYPKEYLDEIKTRLKVSTVVSKTVSLKKRGKEFVGLSPFKNEKTPSFTVNDEKEFHHCFSTSEHGNIFDFLMKTKNYKFGEAVRILASNAGMEPFKFTKEDEEKKNRWQIYKKIMEKYVSFCHAELISKKIFIKNKILTPKYIKFKFKNEFKINKKFISNVNKKLSFPVVIKPINEGSSVNVFICNKKNFVSNLKKLAIYKEILIEKYIPGREIQVAILGKKKSFQNLLIFAYQNCSWGFTKEWNIAQPIKK